MNEFTKSACEIYNGVVPESGAYQDAQFWMVISGLDNEVKKLESYQEVVNTMK